MKSKKGLSQIIATVIIIGIVISISVVVFGFINNLITTQLTETESCFGNFGEVNLNSQFTCYDSTAKELRVSISLEDTKIDGIIVSISSEASGKSFKIEEGISLIYLRTFNGAYNDPVSLPGKNSGITYVIKTVDFGIADPSTVKIAPTINDNQCEVSDSISGIGAC